MGLRGPKGLVVSHDRPQTHLRDEFWYTSGYPKTRDSSGRGRLYRGGYSFLFETTYEDPIYDVSTMTYHLSDTLGGVVTTRSNPFWTIEPEGHVGGVGVDLWRQPTPRHKDTLVERVSIDCSGSISGNGYVDGDDVSPVPPLFFYPVKTSGSRDYSVGSLSPCYPSDAWGVEGWVNNPTYYSRTGLW